ncbi:MAG TPA: PilC/PilY family type IV pilus protein [Cellvibrio sp.]|nr:PilC/PilY family type IV pilus protein [Cellvibrio sp.]
MKNPFFKLGGLFVYLSATLFSANTHSITLAQSPLFLSSGVEPNIMFVLDDSGSMQFESIPESLIIRDPNNTARGTFYLFPIVTNMYGGASYTNWIPTFNNTNIHGMIMRSKNNALYYNPAIRYSPWPSSAVAGGTMDNANPTCALHNPRRVGTGQNYCRDLTADVSNQTSFAGIAITWRSCTSLSNSSCSTPTSHSYYPATYYYYSGGVGGEWTSSNYTKQEIRSGQTYSNHGRNSGKRTDCNYSNGVFQSCSYAQEIQNFANWYTYYRSRILATRAGVGAAFAVQGEGMRVGFGTINTGTTTVDGQSGTVVLKGVRTFNTAAKQTFLQTLYDHTIPNEGTPLRDALVAVGGYYSRADNAGPWGKEPGVNNTEAHAECRASNTILMTDGYWGVDGTINVGNSDNTNGSAISGPNNSTFTYTAKAPFKDSQSNTLADVAMEYWKKDLRSTLANRVKPNDVDPAFWQHMTTFTVGFGVEGSISPIPVIKDVINNSTVINWPTVVPSSITDPAKIDDMLHAAINGHGGYFSAREPDVFAEELSNVLTDITRRESNNAAAAAANSTSLNSNSVVYTAVFDSQKWTGRVEARRIEKGKVIEPPVWESKTLPAANRNIFTFNGAAGVPFLWGDTNNPTITAAQQDLLKGGQSDAYGQARLNWVRGVDDPSTNAAFGLRFRDGKLIGDIVNSDPALAGTNSLYYENLSPALGGDKYAKWYETIKKVRKPVLYVGANDGMLHGFNAGTTGTPGLEVFAYVPSQVYDKLRGLANIGYGEKTGSYPHQYSVNGPIHVGDAYINGEWKNLLVGTLGAGGKGIFVLDITDPDSFDSSDVLFELTGSDYAELGNITSMPVIAPGEDNKWKIYVSNGYNSTSGRAFLGVIDIESEIQRALDKKNKTTISKGVTRFIPTDSSIDNGLSAPALLIGDKGGVYTAYAGDLNGNMWKFDLAGDTQSSWKVAYGAPLFVAKDTKGNAQPITGAPTIGYNSLTSPASRVVYFGTGRYLASTDNVAGTDVQSFYAIADKGVRVTATNRSTLHVKTITQSGSQRTVSGEFNFTPSPVNAVNWKNVDGWYMDLNPGEKMITKPLLIFDRLIFTTVTPSSDACEPGGKGWLIELVATGGNYVKTSQPISLDAPILSSMVAYYGNPLPSGQNGSASPTSGASSSANSDCASGDQGDIIIVGNKINAKSEAVAGKGRCQVLGRQSWRELR